jgi:DNA-binding SARP family transcriptional activator
MDARMLRIWLFGSLSIDFGDSGDAAQAVAGRSASLLAYLALGHGRTFSRSELLSSLWPERGSSSGSSGSFNTALWRLRRLIERPPHRHGELIVSDRRGAIGLNSAAHVWLDVEEFDQLVAPGLSKPPERLADQEIEALRRGVQLYKSDILLDVSEDWALREREKYRRNYLNALGRLMQIATIRRDYAEGIRHAQAILDSDALREDVHRELMQLFVLSGQRALALRQFEQCRELLRRELAIQPMRETLALYQRIADSAVGHAPEPEANPVQSPLQGWPMPASAPMQPASGENAHAMIHIARCHLAAADSQLQLSLQLLP